jgi:hypothetical protein
VKYFARKANNYLQKSTKSKNKNRLNKNRGGSLVCIFDFILQSFFRHPCAF